MGIGVGSAPKTSPYIVTSLDPNLADERVLTVSGDLTLSDGGPNNPITLGLGATAVVAGTYTKVTVDSKGRVTSGTTLVSSDVPAILTNKTLASTPTDGEATAVTVENVSNVSPATKVALILRPDIAGGTAKLVAGRFASATDGGSLDIQTTRSGGGAYASSIFINNSGSVGINTSSPNLEGYGSARTVLTIKGATQLAALELACGLTEGTLDVIGLVNFEVPTNTGSTSPVSASIMAVKVGSTVSNRGADISFSTKVDGVAGIVERMRITSAGDVVIGTGSLGVGTTSPATTALLDLTSTTKGFLSPRMTTAQRDLIAAPATGLLIYNTTTASFDFYTGATWAAMSSGLTGALTAGRVPFATGATTLGDDAKLAWDNTNKTLRIGGNASIAGVDLLVGRNATTPVFVAIENTMGAMFLEFRRDGVTKYVDYSLLSNGITFKVDIGSGITTHETWYVNPVLFRTSTHETLRLESAGVGIGGQTGVTAAIDIIAGTTSQASMRIRSGVAPTFPNDGDVWQDGANLFAQIASVSAKVAFKNMDNAFSVAETFAVDRGVYFSNQTDSAGVSAGTLGNAPAAGNPTFWLKIKINGSTYAIPCWAG